MRKTPEERFWEKVGNIGGEGCWEWQAARTQNGYGYFYHDGRVGRAHRWSYFNLGDAEDYPMVMHLCNNPPCVRPDHLQGGTNQDNLRYCTESGRWPQRHGERNPNAKLTDAQAWCAAVDYESGMTLRQVGDKYGVTLQAIHLIVKGKTYVPSAGSE